MINGQNIVFTTIKQNQVPVQTVESIVECLRNVDWNINCTEQILKEHGL